MDDMAASHSTDLQQRAYELKGLLALPRGTVGVVMPEDASCEDIEVRERSPKGWCYFPRLSLAIQVEKRGLGGMREGFSTSKCQHSNHSLSCLSPAPRGNSCMIDAQLSPSSMHLLCISPARPGRACSADLQHYRVLFCASPFPL